MKIRSSWYILLTKSSHTGSLISVSQLGQALQNNQWDGKSFRSKPRFSNALPSRICNPIDLLNKFVQSGKASFWSWNSFRILTWGRICNIVYDESNVFIKTGEVWLNQWVFICAWSDSSNKLLTTTSKTGFRMNESFYFVCACKLSMNEMSGWESRRMIVMCSIRNNQRPRFHSVISTGNYHKRTFISPYCGFPFSKSFGLKYTALNHIASTISPNFPFLFFLERFIVIACPSFDAWILTATCKSWKVTSIYLCSRRWAECHDDCYHKQQILHHKMFLCWGTHAEALSINIGEK